MRIDPKSEETTNLDEETSNNDKVSEDEQREKVIVRSNGLVTYVGKDIAYQFWKFGLLGQNFHYRWFQTQRSGRPLWATSSAPPAPSDTKTPPPFGLAGAVYNVIDTRQSYLQLLLGQALRALQHPEEAERSIHFSYEMVALSRATASALGFSDADTGDDKAFVEVSGRKGLGVKADDLLNQVTAHALREVNARHDDLEADDQQRIAAIIGTAAQQSRKILFQRFGVTQARELGIEGLR